MISNPNVNPPHGSGSTPPPSDEKKTKAGGGQFSFTGEHQFLGMTFEAKDWNKLMDICLKNLSDYINKTFQKMTDKLKKDWKRSSGEDVDD